MIKEGDYLVLEDNTAVVHILKLDEKELIYEQGWYSSHVCGLSAGYDTQHIDLTDPSLPEPVFYYNDWINFFEETYEKTNEETFNRIYNKSAMIVDELDALKLKLSV